MAKLNFTTKEEWLNSGMGQRMIEEAQKMLEKAKSIFEFDVELGVEQEVTYMYPTLGSKLDISNSRAMEVCFGFSAWAVMALERDWKRNGNIWDIIWNIAKQEKCHIRAAFQWVMAGTEYRGEDSILVFSPWWP